MTTPSSTLHNISAIRDVASDPARTFATAPVTEADPVILELRLLQSLARLQTLDVQLNDLRTLLPSRLLAPLNPILRPRSAASVPAPSILLQQLEKSARGGLEEVEAFKRGWKDGEMAKVWNRVRTAEEDGGAGLVQGTDTWDIEYQDMVDGREEGNKTSKLEGGSPGNGDQKQEEQGNLDVAMEGEEDTETIIATFREKQPNVKVNVLDAERARQIDVRVSGMQFVFTKAQEGQQAGNWVHHREGEKEHKLTGRQMGIVRCLECRMDKKNLSSLLEMLGAYVDLMTCVCVRCNDILDSKARFPVWREKKQQTLANGDQTDIWIAFHEDCQ